MSNLGITLSIISVIFIIGAFTLYKNTPKQHKHNQQR